MSTYDGSLFCISNWLNHRGNLASPPQDLLWMLKEFRPQNKDFWLNIACGAGILLVERGIGIFGFTVLAIFWSVFRFLCQKNFGFSVWRSLRFADFPYQSIWFSIFAKNTNGFSDLIFDAVFGFSYLTHFGFRFFFDLSGNYVPPLISNSS